MSTAPTPPETSSEEARSADDLAGTTQEVETEAGPVPDEPVDEPVDADDAADADDAQTLDDLPAEAEEGEGTDSKDEPEPPKPYVNPLVEILRAELAERDEQLRSYITAYKEATADMERERERMARQRETVLDRERMDLSGRLLPVLDNLGRSLAGCKPGADPVDVADGLRLVRDGFLAALGDLGVERIEAMGATFDANLHEATAMIPASGKQADQEIIFEELPGYTLKGKLLRATRVVVASKPD